MYGGEEQQHALTIYTDAYVIRGNVASRQRRVTDILNNAEHEFIVLTDTVLDEHGSRSGAERAEYAQVNLAAVLFAISDTPVESTPEMRQPKVAEEALVSIPPFKIVGHIYLQPEATLREALLELTNPFIPVTDATYWSDIVAEARTTAPLIAFNRRRAQILAPHREIDPWAGLARGDAATGTTGSTTGKEGRSREDLGWG
jgi:hypothetical protein